ncbi:MAG: hypothetical protein [Caudoviricetes sp.]|nr:MAG: hypothetical protein [Caudoviricetes sp.]
MKTKLLSVINSCKTIKQLDTANVYLYLYAMQVGLNAVYYECLNAWYDKVQELTGAIMRNLLDYKFYAEHMILNGREQDAKDFIELAENELRRLEK